MTVDEARQLFAYGSWANGLVFDAAERLPHEQATAALTSSFPSLAGTLGHLVGAEWIWLRRWLGESPTGAPAWAAEARLPELRRQLAALEAERDAFLGRLSEHELAQPVSYRTLAGQPYSDRLDGLIRHVVNHSTYHRGQATTLLRQLGQKPPSTDLVVFLRLPR